jgi:hypothetical protein
MNGRGDQAADNRRRDWLHDVGPDVRPPSFEWPQQNDAKKWNLGQLGSGISGLLEKTLETINGLRILRSQSKCSPQTVEVIEMINVLSECGFRTWLGGRESLPQFSETPTKTGIFR